MNSLIDFALLGASALVFESKFHILNISTLLQVSILTSCIMALIKLLKWLGISINILSRNSAIVSRESPIEDFLLEHFSSFVGIAVRRRKGRLFYLDWLMESQNPFFLEFQRRITSLAGQA